MKNIMGQVPEHTGSSMKRKWKLQQGMDSLPYGKTGPGIQNLWNKTGECHFVCTLPLYIFVFLSTHRSCAGLFCLYTLFASVCSLQLQSIKYPYVRHRSGESALHRYSLRPCMVSCILHSLLSYLLEALLRSLQQIRRRVLCSILFPPLR